jgi:hypothetical protein
MNIITTAVCSALVLAFAAPAAAAPDADRFAARPAEDAPAALAHFEPLIGRWEITDWTKDEDGNWVEGTGADWDFWYALDGWAVQDLWVRPGRDTELDDEKKRFIGTNLRMWDPAAEAWKMSWIFKGPGAPQNWTATSTPDEIVMSFTPPGAEEPAQRIRFFNMTGDSFDWMMTARGDDGEWAEAYKIRGVRKP